MAEHWLKKDVNFFKRWLFPELKRFERTEDRESAYNDAVREAIKRHPTLSRIEDVCFFAMIAYFVLAFVFGLVNIGVWPMLLVGSGLSAVKAIRLRRRIRVELKKILHEDFWCHECDYLLKGNTSGRCPECGTAMPESQRSVITGIAS